MLKAKETYDQDLMRFRQKLSQLQNQNIDLINELDYMKKQLSQTNKQVSKLTNSNSKLKTIYDAKEMEFDGFMKQRQQIEDKLRKKVKQCEEEKASLLAKNETQKNHISKLVESIAKLKSKMEAIQSDSKKTVKSLVTAKDKQIEELNKENKELLDKTKKSQKESHQAAKKQEEELSDLRKCLSVSKEKIVELGNLLSGEKLKKKKLNGELKSINERVLENSKYTQLGKHLFSLTSFKGEIREGQKEGECEERDDNYHFKGSYKEGKKSGLGKLKNRNIEIEGYFVNNKLHGKGTLINKTNDKEINGEFIAGVYTGNELSFGRITYKGGIVNNEMCGVGYLQFTNKYTFEGKFTEDRIVEDSEGCILDITTGKEHKVLYKQETFTNTQSKTEKFVIDHETGQLLIRQ